MIKAVLACDEAWGIGRNGYMPWPHNSSDLKWFKQQTINTTVLMGRTTWESLPKKPLPNRRNIVVTSKVIDGVESFTIDQATTYLKSIGTEEVCIIGGAKLFSALFPYIDELHLSRIQGKYDCDTVLPEEAIYDNFYLSSGHMHMSGLYTQVWKRQ